MSQYDKQQAIKEIQESLMSDILEEFSFLTVWQRVQLVQQLRDRFCLTCGDPQSKNHFCEK